MMLKALLITLLVAGAFATENNETSPAGGPKEGTAGGHYYPNYGYPPPPPPPAYSYPWAPPAYTPPLVDDYVCDIDASILVVTNAGRDTGNDNGYGNGNGYGNNNGYGSSQNTNPYGGHHHHYPQQQKPNADRLKCSVIANYDEATCTSCCRIAARRDRSIASASVIGFIVDETQLDYDQNDNSNGPYRAKRGAPPQATYGVPSGGASPPAGQRPAPYYPTPVIVSQANPLGPKGRCVCCAPRKFGIPHFAPPHHGGY